MNAFHKMANDQECKLAPLEPKCKRFLFQRNLRETGQMPKRKCAKREKYSKWPQLKEKVAERVLKNCQNGRCVTHETMHERNQRRMEFQILKQVLNGTLGS